MIRHIANFSVNRYFSSLPHVVKKTKATGLAFNCLNKCSQQKGKDLKKMSIEEVKQDEHLLDKLIEQYSSLSRDKEFKEGTEFCTKMMEESFSKN